MFQITNSAQSTEIDILGAIGEDWFGEGNTLETVKNSIQSIENDITVNISSLGGDLIHALAIHDMFKAHPSRVTTNIVGATASAGTVIALGGDSIKISENSLFLGHRASMVAGGNADDLREAANDLDKFDSRLIAIYKKKTGKTKAEIENWLKEDKWITAQEAKAFGLVDEVVKPKKVLNTVELAELSKIHELPQNFKNPAMENTNDSTIKNSILNLLGVKNDASLKAENEALKEEIAKLKANPTNSVDITPFTAEIETLKGEVSNKATEFDKLKAELDALKVTNEATEAELAKYKAGEVENNGTDPANPIVENATTEAKPLRFQPTSDFAKQAILNSKIKNSVIN